MIFNKNNEYDIGLCIFFFKQMTAYEMRISDWSSDVCSSDLPARRQPIIAWPFASWTRCARPQAPHAGRRRHDRHCRNGDARLIHLSVAIARFIETLLWALLRASLSLAGLALIGIALVGLGYMLVRYALKRSRGN